MESTPEKNEQLDGEAEEEHVLLELDGCLYSDVPANAPYVLSGLDTMTPTLVIGDHLKLIGEYRETIGTCYLFSEIDHSGMSMQPEIAPQESSVVKNKSTSDRKEALSKEVKHIATVQKILKFRLVSDDQSKSDAVGEDL